MVTTSDLEKWQKTVEGIEAGQINLSPDELSAFNTLKGLFNSGNLESNESGVLIQTLKEALPSHGNHRLLQKVHLPNFIKLCETYFVPEIKTGTPPVFTPPTFVPPTFQPPVIQPPIPPTTPTLPTPPPTSTPPVIQPPTIQPPVSPEITTPEPVVEKPIITTPPISPAPPVIVPDIPKDEDNIKTPKSNKQLFLIIAAIVLLIAGWQVYKNWDSVSNWAPINKLFRKNKTTISNDSVSYNNPLVGKWKGMLNNDSTTLEFLSIDTVGNINAQIYFTENRHDTLKLNGTKEGYFIDLKDTTGVYSGILQRDSSIYSGTFYDKNSGTSSNFSFRNPKIAVDSLSEQIGHVDTTITTQVEDSATIAPPTQESEKTTSGNSSKTNTQTVNQTSKIITKTYSFGTYKGSAVNGYPEGNGKMIYYRQVQIAKQDTKSPPHFASNGDYFVGSWGNGDIISGILYDKNGNVKEKILAPKRFNLHDISND